MYSKVPFSGEPQPCGHDRYHYGGFRYLKISKLLLGAIFAGGPAVHFVNGRPVDIQLGDQHKKVTFRTVTRRTVKIHDDQIVLANQTLLEMKPQEIKIVWITFPYDLASYLWNFNYRVSGFGRWFIKEPEQYITRGDTQIEMRLWNPDDYNITPLPEGINRIYMVDNADGYCYLRGMVDALGAHFMPEGDSTERDNITFIPKEEHDDCSGVRYKPGEFWDFSKPIPRNMILEEPTPCCAHLVQ
jgi:hypothetical protein